MRFFVVFSMVSKFNFKFSIKNKKERKSYKKSRKVIFTAFKPNPTFIRRGIPP
jgi:hypothetical protein